MSWIFYSRHGARSSASINQREVGSMIHYPSATPPDGWLLADGSVVSQSTYLDLFSKIGTLYNTGLEGAGNFRLPNATGKFLRGAGTFGVGSSSGQSAHSHPAITLAGHTTTQGHQHSMPSHTHISAAHSHTADHRHGAGSLVASASADSTAPTTDNTGSGSIYSIKSNHTHNINTPIGPWVGNTDSDGSATSSTYSPGNTGSQSSSINLTAITGSADSTTSLPPYASLYVIIKT